MLKEEAERVQGGKYTIHPSMLVDVASGHSCRMDITIGHGDTEFQVISSALSRDDFCSIDPLKKLLNASIETGNPIHWY